MPSLDNPGATVTSSQVAQIQATLGIIPPTFNYYATHFDSLPTTETFTGPGTVISYTLNSVTRYRFIPDPYDPSEDAFYQNFDGSTLSNLVVRRNLTTT